MTRDARSSNLPIEAVKKDVLDAFARGPFVLSAPTGSGKSTQVPRWLAQEDRVLVVEPRRVACRALAARVADLEGCRVGDRVGYIVRDDRRATDTTQIIFATPGVALRMLASGDGRTLILDEFHERGLDLDLLLALALRDGAKRLVVMSATLDGDRIAEHVGGPHVRGEGRLFEVQRRYVAGDEPGPTERDLVARVLSGLDDVVDVPGDVLIFLPGRAEIGAVAAALARRPDLEVLELHGGLPPSAQQAALNPRPPGSTGRRVVVATNVAETSLTLPGIGVVIDSGLVRRTAYHGGRGYLTLLPIAADAADQRAGRAGRLGPGVCVRLWRKPFKLDESTPPAIRRESLVPLVLGALAAGITLKGVNQLPFLEPPKDYAFAAAVADLERLGALENGTLGERGRAMFRLPLDADLARLLVEGETRGLADDVIPLCASLASGRRLFVRRPDKPEDDLRGGCDAVGGIRAVRIGRPHHGLDGRALEEARRAARRFRSLLGLPRGPGGDPPVDRKGLALALLAAWPDSAHVARRRKGRVAWAAGGTELALGRDVMIDEEKIDAVIVLASRAFTKGALKRQLVITAAMPIPLTWLAQAGLGDERLAGTGMQRGRLVATIERVYAGRVLSTRTEAPSGELARVAVRDLFLRGTLFRGKAKLATERLETLALAAQLAGDPAPPALDAWVLTRLETLGLEAAEDLQLLSGDDLVPDAVPEDLARRLERDFPTRLKTGDASYRVAYDVKRKRATLHQVGGARKLPPADMFLPRLPGWTLLWELKNRVRTLRGR